MIIHYPVDLKRDCTELRSVSSFLEFLNKKSYVSYYCKKEKKETYEVVENYLQAKQIDVDKSFIMIMMIESMLDREIPTDWPVLTILLPILSDFVCRIPMNSIRIVFKIL